MATLSFLNIFTAIGTGCRILRSRISQWHIVRFVTYCYHYRTISCDDCMFLLILWCLRRNPLKTGSLTYSDMD